MDKDRDNSENNRATEGEVKPQPARHSSAFNEQSTRDQKSTHNVEEEASAEQERKEAMTERD